MLVSRAKPQHLVCCQIGGASPFFDKENEQFGSCASMTAGGPTPLFFTNEYIALLSPPTNGRRENRKGGPPLDFRRFEWELHARGRGKTRFCKNEDQDDAVNGMVRSKC